MFDNGTIRVDRDFVRVGSKSYAVDKIASIDIRTHTQPGQDAYRYFWVAGAICTAVAIVNQSSWFALVAGILIIGGFPSYRLRHRKTFFKLVLFTNAGEAQAFESTDGEEISNIREAIEAAMTAR